MKILKRVDNGAQVEMSEQEVRLFIEYFLRRCEFGEGQEEINEFIKSYDFPGQLPYEYMLQ